MLRSLLAIVVGMLTIAVLATGADALLGMAMPVRFAPDGRSGDALVLVLMIAYSAIASGVGGYVAARIARRAEVKHALALALVQGAMSVVLSAMADAQTPTWFNVLSVVLPFGATILGGYLRAL